MRLVRTASLAPIGAGSFSAFFGLDGAEGLGGFVFGGHGIGCLVGASLPADEFNLSQRLVLSNKIRNYFHGPIPGLPHNI
jgi:hypothetical protein